ncbi:SpaA isopeptide-forming pilin-related protein, partial [Anaerotignum faecicola]|nr:SpaA isopeptide-forming pilin-related protein [Anaerotignum faecicola]
DKSPAKAVRDFSGFKEGEELIFTTSQEFKSITGQLTAGGEYWLHEVKPRDGYALAEDVPFTVDRDGNRQIVVMADRPTHVVLSKKALTGSQELPGNHMAVRDEGGKVLERWISGEKPHEITAKLTAGKTYYLCEETPESGYAYAEEVPFTVSEDGSVDLVEMRNDVTRVRIHKQDQSGNAIKGAILQILEAKKEIVILEFETTG